MNKIAFVTGVTGQDGSYLAELLLDKGYEVHGLVRSTSHFNRGHIEPALNKASREGKKFLLHYGDMHDGGSLSRLLGEIQPTEIYNLAAQSHVRISFDEPDNTANINGLGVLRLLEAMRTLKPGVRFYQASTSELFGKVVETPQKETTPFYPRSPYAVAKLYAYWIVKHYREAYDLHASNGILFNHESPRRGENFVTRKITYSLARILAGVQKSIVLGNLDAKRDWGFAPDFVEAMWRLLQQDVADDYVIATGQTNTVRKFIEVAAAVVGMQIEWQGEGVDEFGVDRASGETIVSIDPKYYRPTEVDLLCGDPTKARTVLGWEPRVQFEQLVETMMLADLELLGLSLATSTTVEAGGASPQEGILRFDPAHVKSNGSGASDARSKARHRKIG